MVSWRFGSPVPDRANAMTNLFYVLASWLFRAGVWSARRLPERAALPFQRVLLEPAFRWWRDRRRTNAALFAPGPDGRSAEALDRRYRDYHRWMAVQFARHPYQSEEDFNATVVVEGIEALKAALAAGRGALVTGPHLGCYFYTGAALAARGVAVTCVTTDLPIASVDRHMRRIARRFGFKTIPAGLAVAREARRRFGQNGVLWVFNDVTSQRSKNQWLPLGPYEIWGSTGAAALAQAHRVPVLLAAERWDGGRHVLTLSRTAGGDSPDYPAPLDLTRRWFHDMYPELERRPQEWQTLGYGRLRRPSGARS